MSIETNPDILDFLRNNHLFASLSETQLSQLANIVREVSFAENEYIIHENEISDEIYFIKEGEVEVSKFEPVSGQFMPLTVLGSGAVVGEITLLDQAPRSASVRAIKSAILYVLSINELQSLTSDNATNLNSVAEKTPTALPLYSLVIQNLAKNLSHRMRMTNDAFVEGLRRELEHTKARAAMGIVITTVMVVMAIYLLVIEVLNKTNIVSPALMSMPLIALFSCIIFVAVKKTDYPMSFYGVTLNNWRTSVKESVLFTLPFLVLITLYKWCLINFSPDFIGHSLFEFTPTTMHSPHPILLGGLVLIGYMVFVPLQEFMVRGALQSPLQELLVSRHKIWWSILLSNLLFSVSHFHISLGTGFITYLPGLFWGWMYARHRTLIGVCISHQLVGIWGLFILGIF